jgi:hypothetical protein
LIKAHCTDERWREVFLLATSLLPDASQFMMIFRRGVDELLKGDEKLKALLERTDKTSASIQAEMIKHRNVGLEWDLTQIQEALLADYLNARHLLQDCLKLATMPPDEKRAMLNSLYLPPAEAGNGQKA